MLPTANNLRVAWALLGVAFLAAAVSLSGLGQLQALGVETQIACLRMGLLQALFAGLFASEPLQRLERRLAAPLALIALVYVFAFASASLISIAIVIPTMAALNFGAVTFVLVVAIRGSAPTYMRWLLVTLAFGMALDIWLGLTEWDPALIPEYLAPASSVRMRMFRLARIAAIALPLLATLHADLLEKADVTKRHVRWARVAIRIGAVALPIALVLTALTWTNRKQLVSMASLCMMFGTTVGAILAYRQQRRLEGFGWSFMTGSMFIGYLIAGFAFGGPFPVPDFMGEHDSIPRTMVRQAHTFSIVVGVLMILFGRMPVGRAPASLLVSGAVAMTLTLVVGGWIAMPGLVLAIGPVAVAIAIGMRWLPGFARTT